MIPKSLSQVLARQHYHMAGSHSAVKPCLWLKKSLRGEGHCYKQTFYGIESLRCMQATPAVAWCTQACLFCWRNTGYDIERPKRWDEPEKLVESMLSAHRQAISGFGGSEGVDPALFKKAQDPNQVALSLCGEPMEYPHMSCLIGEFAKRGMTTFLVSNGTYPDRINSLESLPTNLYVSLTAPDKKTHKKVDAPMISGAWERIMQTLGLLPSLDTRTVIRITAVDGLNMRDTRGYARILEKAQPDHIEVKAFMFVGGARTRLSRDNMPSHTKVRDFANEIAAHMSYELSDQRHESRVVLLSKT